MKRLMASLLGGVLCAGICVAGGTVLNNGSLPELSLMLGASILNRLLIGFVIGISGLKKMNYILHGAVIGFIVSFTVSIGFLGNNNIFEFIIYTSAGIIYGIIIELIATKLFKAGIA